MTTAKDRWAQLESPHSAVLDRARACADLTIPSLLPPMGSDSKSNLPTPYQSLGARGVNNLASKAMMALFPPNQSFFRFQIDDDVAEELGDTKDNIEDGLRRLENRAMKLVEAGNLRSTIHSILKHLIVAGNTLLHLPSKGRSRMYRLTQYRCVRDPSGLLTEAVIEEKQHPATIPEEIRIACDVTQKVGDTVPVCVYTWLRLTAPDRYEYHQEINGKEVPGTKGASSVEDCPYIALRWIAVENEDYGRSHVEEYLGDLRSLEGLTRAVVAFSAAASKIVLMLKQNATTDEDELVNAESGAVIRGNREDVAVLQLDKYADFKVTKEVADDITLRLSHAFLLQSGTVRNAERVTAEEIRAMAQELEDVLGGTYTVLSQELQLPVVRRLIAAMKAMGDFPKLPKGALDPVIVTGFDALGRGHEVNRLRQYFADLNQLVPNAISQFSPQKVAKRLGVAHNVDVEELLMTEDEIADTQAQTMTEKVVDKGAGPAVAGIVKGMANEQA